VILSNALRRLQSRLTQPASALASVARAIAARAPDARAQRLLERLQLAEPRTPIEHVYRRLVLSELSREGP
jgi:hypothetical protein